MPYRPTHRTLTRQAETRRRILDAAQTLVIEAGYRGAQVASVAKRAEVATGTFYRYFPSKDELFAEVFQLATRRELERVAIAAHRGGSVRQRIARVVEVFARWALQERSLAYALIAEPLDSAAGQERQAYRRGYQRVLKGLIAEAVAGELCAPVDPAITAAFVVGGLVEAVLGPLSPEAGSTDQELQVNTLVATVDRAIFGDSALEGSASMAAERAMGRVTDGSSKKGSGVDGRGSSPRGEAAPASPLKGIKPL
ncbi:MAG: TetR/AcrR family transcriptional regulator [Acidobacteriota bacterium]